GIAFANAQIHGAGMFINPYFRFKGSVHIGSTASYLFLNGYYKPTQYFKGFNPKWVRFASALQSNNIVFPATFPMKGEAGETIYATLHYNFTSGKLYPAFFAPKTFSGDTALLVAEGFVGYDTVGKFYYISNTPYEHGGSNRNIIRFNTQESKISGNGKINFGHEFGRVSMLPAGSIKHYATADSTILELFAAFDFFFSREAFELIIKQFENATLQNVSLKPTVEAGIHALFKPDEAERLISELGTRGSLRRLPDNLSRALIFNDLTMIWNHRTRSFTSTGPLGVMIINGQQVNKYVEGRVEIIRRTEGDAFNIYLEQAPNQWFFFHYSAGVLHAVSSLDEFNSAIAKMSEERRMLPARKQEVPYRFVAGTTHMRDAFVQRMR
ncbi:MAG TPA: hypothetical protein VLH16_04485, partial [Bacteroidales bacterium]|nr:hypothetical protein [Bacteroidales bacterium]